MDRRPVAPYCVGVAAGDGFGDGDGAGEGVGVGGGGGDGWGGRSCSICGIAQAVYSVIVSATFAHQYDLQVESVIGAMPSPPWIKFLETPAHLLVAKDRLLYVHKCVASITPRPYTESKSYSRCYIHWSLPFWKRKDSRIVDSRGRGNAR